MFAAIRLLLVFACSVLLSLNIYGAGIPLRVESPTPDMRTALPVCGGIPFPKGVLISTDNLRLLDEKGKEIPLQVTKTAVWPDGSIKWVLLDAVLKPAMNLQLEYGKGVNRKKITDSLEAKLTGSDVMLTGGQVEALIRKDGKGIIEKLVLGGETVVAEKSPAELVLNTLRIKDGTSGRFLPTNTYVCRDTSATIDKGIVKIQKLSIETSGPVRVTVLMRGTVQLPRLGATLPDKPRRDSAGRIPFSLRLSFYRGIPLVYGEHQIVFSGEPDCDYISRWGIRLPGLAGPSGRVILEPGVELASRNGTLSIAEDTKRMCAAPLKNGFALIRQGWENRPCAITQSDKSAWIDFWPSEAGVWDLRRYAREWAVGESGNTKDPSLMKYFAKYAAYGIAKSHTFLLYYGKSDPIVVDGFAKRSLLVAPPAWYGSTEALGLFVPEQTSGANAAADIKLRRQIDYHLFCQDLYNWYGKTTYGFWQTRHGQIHRYDRWDRDYGRWAWSLNDGAGRIGHMLMLQYLRTLDRRYLDAGEAFNRINYDTNMVHTRYHLENSKNWWTTTGCSHRHNVQPFGCPYIGMRGSYPVGQRILYLLTGDGVIRDGLEIVADTSFQYASGRGSRLCNSGGSDGQGSAANALLWKYETTGDRKYLDACRYILERSELIPPKNGKRLGYGPGFGLFHAADEYAELAGDKEFRKRIVELAKLGAASEKSSQFIHPMATGYRFSKDPALRKAVRSALTALGKPQNSLDALPAERWPGHCGWRSNALMANVARDIPLALAVLDDVAPTGGFPKPMGDKQTHPAEAPSTWYRPGGIQAAAYQATAARNIAKSMVPGKPAPLVAGGVTWVAEKSLADTITVNNTMPLTGPIKLKITLAEAKDGDNRTAAKYTELEGKVVKVGTDGKGSIIASGKAGPVSFIAQLQKAVVEKIPCVRITVACKAPPGSGQVVSWGLLFPLKVGGNRNLIQATAPGRFRLERCRLDQNDERIPNWLTSEYHWPDGTPLWPLWRLAGINIGPGRHYQIWHANMENVSPVVTDMGEGDGNWLDFTDRGATPRWGVTVRMLRKGSPITSTERCAVRVNMVTGALSAQFHDPAAAPLPESSLTSGLTGAADIFFHNGWRSPLSKPELTQAQYEKFLDDLDYGGNYGLFALRFRFSKSHMVKGRKWVEMIRDRGIEPRELLYSMQWKGGLAKHARRIGVATDDKDIEKTVQNIIEHYR